MKHIQCASDAEKATVSVCIRSHRQNQNQDGQVASQIQALQANSHHPRILEKKAP